MLRIRHPDVFWGSIPSSPALRSFGPFANNTDKFVANDFVSRNYYSQSFVAATKINRAMAIFNACSTNSTCSSSGLLDSLNLCGPQPNSTELRAIYESLTYIYKHISQFNYIVPTAYYDANPLSRLLNATKRANSTAAVLRAPM
jgi:hypothetical protein